MTIREEIKNIKSNKSEWKKFGMMMGIILTMIGFYLIWKKNNNYYYYPLSFAAAFFAAGLFLPVLLKPVYKAWMILSVVMGFIMTKVIMVVIFYLILTPLGLIASMTGKKFLDMKIDKSAKSYWITREKTQKLKSDYERQF
jgi:glucan phosphoethanolaminetransferase (alkaline phosphatase superfamily)